VNPIVVGIETDEDAFIVHGEDGKSAIELSNLKDPDEALLRQMLRTLFPTMKEQVLSDLLPILTGNISHIAEVRSQKRTPVEASHMEQILGVGGGFEWLHLINKALLIGPYSHNLETPIAKAASILLSNIDSGRIPKGDGVVVMSSAAYRDVTGIDPLLACEKAKSFIELARMVIERDVPKLVPHIEYLAGTLDVNTRQYHILPIE
jgi:hypothetical protein